VGDTRPEEPAPQPIFRAITSYKNVEQPGWNLLNIMRPSSRPLQGGVLAPQASREDFDMVVMSH